MLTPEQTGVLLETVTRIDTKMELLISNGGSKGMVPELRAKVEKQDDRLNDHDSQIAYWKGAVAVLGFLLVVFGGMFAEHVFGGGLSK